MQSKAASVAEYLKTMPHERRVVIEAVLKVIRANIDSGFEEGMQYGMIGWFVPHRTYPEGYRCNPKQPLPFAHLASQKNHMSLYAMCLYADDAMLKDFRKRWEKTGKKLDMGKSCIRFKKLDDLALDVIGELFSRVKMKDYIAQYEAAFLPAKRKQR